MDRKTPKRVYIATQEETCFSYKHLIRHDKKSLWKKAEDERIE